MPLPAPLPLADQFAGIAAGMRACADERGIAGPLALLETLVLLALARLIDRIEHLVRLWSAGLLPGLATAPRARLSQPTGSPAQRTEREGAVTPPQRHIGVRHIGARHPLRAPAAHSARATAGRPSGDNGAAPLKQSGFTAKPPTTPGSPGAPGLPAVKPAFPDPPPPAPPRTPASQNPAWPPAPTRDQFVTI